MRSPDPGQKSRRTPSDVLPRMLVTISDYEALSSQLHFPASSVKEELPCDSMESFLDRFAHQPNAMNAELGSCL